MIGVIAGGAGLLLIALIVIIIIVCVCVCVKKSKGKEVVATKKHEEFADFSSPKD